MQPFSDTSRLPGPAAALCAAACLGLLLCGCGRDPWDASPLAPGGPIRLLPADRQAGSWLREGKPRRLHALVIPGREERHDPAAFRAMNFQTGAIARYRLPATPGPSGKASAPQVVRLSILQFDHDDHAFAALAHFRPPPPLPKPLPIGAAAYRIGNAVLAWKGRYLIHADASVIPGEEGAAAAVFFARWVASRIPGAGVLSGTLGRLPRSGLRVLRSSWRATRTYDRPLFGEGLEAVYELPGKGRDKGKPLSVRVFVARIGERGKRPETAIKEVMEQEGDQGYRVQETILRSQHVVWISSRGEAGRLTAFAADGRVVLMEENLPVAAYRSFLRRAHNGMTGNGPKRPPIEFRSGRELLQGFDRFLDPLVRRRTAAVIQAETGDARRSGLAPKKKP